MAGFKIKPSKQLVDIPPHCIASEQSLLGCIMLEPSIVGRLTMSEEDMYAPSSKSILKEMKKLNDSGVIIDMITLPDALKKIDVLDKIGGMSYLADIMTIVPASIRWKNYEEIIIDKANRRALIKSLKNSISKLQDESTDVLSIKEEIGKTSITTTKFGYDNADIFQIVADKIDRVESGGSQLFKTGIKPIDDNLGGFSHSSVIALGAPSSGGKSAFAAQLINNMSKEHPVLYFSMEMSVEQIAERWMAQESEHSNKYMQSKAYHDNVNIMGMLSKFLDKRVIKFDRSCDYDYITKSINHHVHRSGVKMVVIDYLQMMDYKGKDLAYEPKNISAVMKGLKSIALESNICIVVLSQLNEKLEYFGASVIRNSSDTCFKILPPYKDVACEEAVDDALSRFSNKVGGVDYKTGEAFKSTIRSMGMYTRSINERVIDEDSKYRSVITDKHRGGDKNNTFDMVFNGDDQMFVEEFND